MDQLKNKYKYVLMFLHAERQVAIVAIPAKESQK